MDYGDFLEKQEQTNFYSFINPNDGKNWLLPCEDVEIGLKLYHPSHFKGKLLKNIIPIICRITYVQRLISLETVGWKLSTWLNKLLCESFGVSDVDFALFGGTPCVHQKITLLLYNKNRILGYCKLTDNLEVSRLFQKESEYLRWLRMKHVTNVPSSLYCEKSNGIYCFIQSTEQTDSSFQPKGFGKSQEEFIKQFVGATTREVKYFETDQYFRIQCYQEKRQLFSQVEQQILDKAIEYQNSCFCASYMKVAAYHADFTPWNMVQTKNKTFVFDFEYSEKTFLPYLDVLHFYSQSLLNAEGYNSEKLFNYYNKIRGRLKYWFANPDLAMIVYLTEIAIRFVLRDGTNRRQDTNVMVTAWLNTLRKLTPSI